MTKRLLWLSLAAVALAVGWLVFSVNERNADVVTGQVAVPAAPPQLPADTKRKNIERVEVRLDAPANLSEVKALRRLIEEALGGEVQPRNITKDVAIFDVTYVDSCTDGLKCATELAAAIKGKQAGKRIVEVVDVGFGKVALRLHERPA